MRTLRKQQLVVVSRFPPLNLTCLIRTIAFIGITALQVHLSVLHFSHPSDTTTPLVLDLTTKTSRRTFHAQQHDETTNAGNKYSMRNNGTIQEPLVTAKLKLPAEDHDYQPHKRKENWDQNEHSSGQTFRAAAPIIISNRTGEPSPSPLHIEQKNRSIILIHVGKAGGMTIRRTLPIPCESRQFKGDEQEQKLALEKCQEHVRTQKLASQIRSTFHMWDYNTTHLEQATSYIVTLRNPVDRIISTYRYNHPQNCNFTSATNANGAKPSMMEGIKGCNLLKFGLVDEPGSMGYQIFRHCFPSPGMEDFAQSVMKPWRSNEHLDNFTNTAERAKCRQLAKHLVQGGHNRRIIPHMMCNYHYYATHSIWKYPGKEIFGIRTEYEWDDMVALDKLFGGAGTFRNANLHHSHGSEYYHPSPISTEAYQKLCCALDHEIEIYFSLLDQSVNLDDAAKEESKAVVREKCDIAPSWLEWRAACLQSMNESDLDNRKEMSI